jgi:hypothetical protein
MSADSAAPALGHRPNAELLDPLDEGHFAVFFDARIAPALKELEAERQVVLKAFWRRTILCAAVIGGAFLLSTPFLGDRLTVPAVMAFVAIWGLVLFKPLKQLGDRAKTRLLTTIAEAMGFTYQLKDFEAPGYERLRGMGLLPKPERTTFDDLFSGERSGAAFAICDANLEREEGSGKDSHWVSVFQGQLIRLSFPKKFLGVTVVARDAGLLNMLHRPKDLERVGLGASEFERDFEVYSTDQVEARFLVHPAFMQKLLDMEAAFQGSKLRGMFCDGELLLAVEGVDRFKVGNAFQRFDDMDQCADAASDLRQVLSVIDFVLAGPPRAPELAPA